MKWLIYSPKAIYIYGQILVSVSNSWRLKIIMFRYHGIVLLFLECILCIRVIGPLSSNVYVRVSATDVRRLLETSSNVVAQEISCSAKAHLCALQAFQFSSLWLGVRCRSIYLYSFPNILYITKLVYKVAWNISFVIERSIS
jgi:hypothetical protein